MEVMEVIGQILPLCKTILWLVSEVRSNKKRCRRLAERVRHLEELVEAIRRGGPGPISPPVNRALWKLCRTLTTAQELLRKCTKTSILSLFKCKSKFRGVNEELSDAFAVLSGALHVDQRSPERRGFQHHAEDVWDDGSGVFGALVPAPYSGAVAPVPFQAGPRPQPTAVYAAMMEVEDDSFFYAQTLFVMQ